MNKTSISEIKMKAKDNLLGYYGLTAGSFALLFALIYALAMILIGAMGKGMGIEEIETGNLTIASRIARIGVSAVIGIFSSLLTVGFYRMIMEISYDRRPKQRELFYCFYNHPDKVIIIYVILTVIKYVFMLPSQFVSWSSDKLMESGEAKKFLLWVVLILIGIVLDIVVSVMFCFTYLFI